MNVEEITGGVSPLKKKWKGKASRGKSGQKRSIKGQLAGSAGIRNTSTRRGRRGFSKAGAKGVNVHGYGALTRFKPHTYKGPLSNATSPKTGGGGGGGTSGGGGGSSATYNVTHGDYHDYSRHLTQENVGNIHDSSKIINKPKNVQKSDIETNVKTNQKNVNKTKQKLESYDDFWNKRIKSGKHSAGMKKYIKKHGGDLVKAREEWEYVSRKYAHIRNKNRQSNKSNVDASVSNPQDQSGSGTTVSKTYNAGGNVSDAFFNSPNKMKSHAWNRIQEQKKAKGGTQKY